jgi:small-conductance mechanosensitive channel
MSASLQDTLLGVAVVALALVAALAVHAVAVRLFVRVPRRGARAAADIVARRCGRASRLLVAAAALALSLPAIDLSERLAGHIRHALVLVIIGAVGWLLIELAGAATDILTTRLDLSAADNLRARRAQTQAMIARRVSAVVIGIVTVAVMLTTFAQVRTLGASLLASAGIAGLVIGIAAQQTLSNLFAGIQIALTEPIRIDDVVVVEGEWGRIEEITFTYVVVTLWDERRLVLPISYFTQTPFENWTRDRSDVLGSVFLHVDYGAPLSELRDELERAVEESDLWDGRIATLQATEAREQTLELRVVVSARDAPTAWNLRCEIRERLVTFLQEHHPGALPRLRTQSVADEREESRSSY